MCRLFGFRSNERASVRPALVSERNALRVQSIEHRDGWGIVHYDGDNKPNAVRGLGPALADPAFERVSEMLAARAVVAHLRLASVGAVELCNVHPFVLGRWTFAHNGTIRNFRTHQERLEKRIAPPLLRHLASDTDSERAFLLFLTLLGPSWNDEPAGALEVATALARTTRELAQLTDTPSERSAMNFLVTDGRVLVASRRDKTLFFATRSKADPALHAPEPGTPLEQFVVASEQLSLREPWFTVAQEELVGVDAQLRFQRWTLGEL